MDDNGTSVCVDSEINYQQFTNVQYQASVQEAQRVHVQMQTEFNNNPWNQQLFAQDANGNLIPPFLFVPPQPDFQDQTNLDSYNRLFIRPNHQARSPIGDHLMSLIFIANSDLTEQQRERFTSHLALRNYAMRQYTLQPAQEAVKTLFANTKTGINDPSVRQGGLDHKGNGHGRHRSFYCFEIGTFDEDEGYWAVDEEIEDLNGFLDINQDSF